MWKYNKDLIIEKCVKTSDFIQLCLNKIQEIRVRLNQRAEIHVRPKSQLKCLEAAFLEAILNIWNYMRKEDDSRSIFRQMSDTFKGKLLELVFVYEHQNEIDEFPAIFSSRPKPEYDLIYQKRKTEIKSSRKGAKSHYDKYPDVVCYYPKNKEIIFDGEWIKYEDDGIEY